MPDYISSYGVVHCGKWVYRVYYIHIGVKFELLVSTMMGNSQAPWTVERAMSGLHVFYLYVLGILF